jgi:NADH-quinone oxidoreductase subunit J
VLLESDFLAIAQIVIYVGGVVVLYLFGVMLTPPDVEERSTPRVIVLATIALVVFITLLAGIGASASSTGGGTLARIAAGVQPVALPNGEQTVINEMGRSLMLRDRYLLPFELVSILLLIALVGAVFIARRRTGETAEEVTR